MRRVAGWFVGMLLVMAFVGSFWAGVAFQVRMSRDASLAVAQKHGERDGFEQAMCAVAVTAAEDWRSLALAAVQAKVGPTLTMGEE